MEGLDMDNILSPDEVDNLFSDDVSQETEVTPPEQGEDNKDKTTTEEPIVDPESLFEEPESVGSGTEDTQKEGENTQSEKTGTSPNKNFYSSIASALKDEGILSDLDDETVGKIDTPEAFAEAMEAQIKAQLDERQRRIDEALSVGVEPTEVRKYEGTIQYLNTITEDSLTAETPEGEKLRKQLIYQDYINRGFDEKRAQRETLKSFNSGSDIDDAKEALASNKDYFQSSYQEMIEEAKREEEELKKEAKREAEQLKKSIYEDSELFGIKLDKPTREKVYESITKPIYKDPESGEYLTAIQKYQRDNKTDFMKKLGLVFALTDGFTNIEKLANPLAKKKVKQSLRELEHTINTTRRNQDGSLNYIAGVSDDPESKAGWDIDA